PDLYRSVVIDVGVLDMLRAENFTVGSTNTNLKEYGTVKESTQFQNLYSYSPYHNVDNTINYPSILLITGDHDNRVPPLHSYKFAAKLQNNPSQINPILLWTQEKTGHYGADNNNSYIEEKSFIYGFLFYELE
ncbi:MAG: prolyl oligopeptidase family serine peptidase, partial [Flavobacteriaceae bacterium]